MRGSSTPLPERERYSSSDSSESGIVASSEATISSPVLKFTAPSRSPSRSKVPRADRMPSRSVEAHFSSDAPSTSMVSTSLVR